MRPSVVASLLWLSLVSGAVACQKAASDPSGAADAGDPRVDPTAPARYAMAEAWFDAGAFTADDPAPLARVELLDAGREPRRVLALAPRAGERRQRRMTMEFTQEFKMSGAPLAKSALTSLSLHVTTRAPTGGGPWYVELGRIELGESPDRALLAAMIAAWRPVAASLEVDAQGRRHPDRRGLATYRDVGINELTRIIEDALDAWIPELPVEPVGDGARWRVRERMVRTGISVEREAIYSLEGGARPRLIVRVTLTGGPQVMSTVGDSRGLPGGDVKVSSQRLEGWTVRLTTAYGFDAGALLPDAAQLEGTIDFDLVDDELVAPAGQSEGEVAPKDRVTSHIDLKVRLEP